MSVCVDHGQRLVWAHARAHLRRRRLAVYERPATSRPRRRFRRAVGRLRALSPPEGERRPDGERHRRARNAEPHPGRRRGPHAEGGRRQVQPDHQRGPPRARTLLRLLHAHHDAQPHHRGAGRLQDALRQGLPHQENRPRRLPGIDRTDVARPVHRGHVSDLRLPERPRRPVRQLRKPARPRAAHQPALTDRRHPSDLQGERALLSRSPGVRRAAHQMDLTSVALAAERAQLLAQLHREPQAARDHPRHRLGRAHPASGMGRPP